MPEVFRVPELVLRCSKRFNTTKRIVRVGDSIVPPINLSPLVFQKMLKLPKLNKELKLPKADAFITNNGGPKRLLKYFTDSLSRVKNFPRCVPFVLSGTFRMDWSFDWAQNISNEIAHQLSSYQQTKKFFMMMSLVYVVVYNCIVKELPVKRNIDISQEPIQFWYLMLWKHKAPFHINQIHY